MSFHYLPLIPVYLAFESLGDGLGKRGVVGVLVGTLIVTALQPEFWRMMKGLREYWDYE